MLIAAGAGTVIGYADSFLSVLLRILPVFLAVYVVLYGSFYFAMKRQAEKINEALDKK